MTHPSFTSSQADAEASAADAEASSQTMMLRTVPPFNERRLAWDRGLDLAMWWTGLVGLVAALGFVIFWSQTAGWGTLAVVMLVMIGWFMLNLQSAKVNQQLPTITALIDADMTMAEHQLAQALNARPLVRWVRSLLYHRLALLRFRQEQYDQTVRICQALLARPLGPAERVRNGLLLTLGDAQLATGDVTGVYHTLNTLAGTKLNLMEHLGKLSLQTRYEMLTEQYEAMLADGAYRVQQAELMSGVNCGAMHAVMAVAAEQVGDESFARWLNRRAQLLLTPEQLESARYGRSLEQPPLDIGEDMPMNE